jgi:hypothetical protein
MYKLCFMHRQWTEDYGHVIYADTINSGDV